MLFHKSSDVMRVLMRMNKVTENREGSLKHISTHKYLLGVQMKFHFLLSIKNIFKHNAYKMHTKVTRNLRHSKVI